MRRGHGQRHKRVKPPWRKPARNQEARKKLLGRLIRSNSLGVYARHIEEENVFDPTIGGLIGTPVDEKMERVISELEGP